MIDLRSDTVTRPTPTMREAMYRAELGDDVFREDPTVNALEEKVAAMFGHEAALFCPSGTMANQIAVKAHTRPGDEVICDANCHIYYYEAGGIAFNSGCSVRLINGDRGVFGAAEVAASIRKDDVHFPVSRLVTIENTCNRGGGRVFPLEHIRAISELCRTRGLALHVDGARLWNAMIAEGTDALTYGSLFDSISVCLSKGLGAPVGSVLTGNAGFIHQARRIRKVFGGGMRQAGMLAAAGIHALDNHMNRMATDHDRAKQIATLLAGLPWVKYIFPVETNILLFDLTDVATAEEFLQHCAAEAGIKAYHLDAGRIRFVFHLDILETDMTAISDAVLSFRGGL